MRTTSFTVLSLVVALAGCGAKGGGDGDEDKPDAREGGGDDIDASTEPGQPDAAPNPDRPDAGTQPRIDAGGNQTSSSVGGPCESDDDCDGGGCIQQAGFVGGYCILFDCTSDGDCPADAHCAQVLTDGTSACIPDCSASDPCRQGYDCITGTTSAWENSCLPGCTSDNDCPTGFGCRADPHFGDVCLDTSSECSPANPTGNCDPGQVCEEGVCRAFGCDDTLGEPNESMATALPLPVGTTNGYQICSGDHDWFKLDPTDANTVYLVGIDSQLSTGDLRVEMVDAQGNVFDDARQSEDLFQAENGPATTNLKMHSILGAPGSPSRWIHISGPNGAQNNYSLVVRKVPWQDGAVCTDLYSQTECWALTAGGNLDVSKFIVFPLGSPNDAFVGDNWFKLNGLSGFGNPLFTSNTTQWGRRELFMILRNSYHAVAAAFPGTKPLGVGDVGLPDGYTPYGHPNGTHYWGANVDFAYFIKPERQGVNGNLTYRQICCDKASLSDWSCVDTNTSSASYGTCVAGSESTHIVDLPRTAMMIAKIAGTGRLRVIGVEAKIQAGINAALDTLVNEGKITPAERTAALDHIATANDDGSWVWHFNHMHASFCTDSCANEKPGQPARFEGPWPNVPRAEQQRRVKDFYGKLKP